MLRNIMCWIIQCYIVCYRLIQYFFNFINSFKCLKIEISAMFLKWLPADIAILVVAKDLGELHEILWILISS